MSVPGVIGDMQLDIFRDSVAISTESQVNGEDTGESQPCIASFLYTTVPRGS